MEDSVPRESLVEDAHSGSARARMGPVQQEPSILANPGRGRSRAQRELRRRPQRATSDTSGSEALIPFFLKPHEGPSIHYRMRPTTKVKDIIKLGAPALQGSRRQATLVHNHRTLDTEATLAQLGLEKDTTLRIMLPGLPGRVAERANGQGDSQDGPEGTRGGMCSQASSSSTESANQVYIAVDVETIAGHLVTVIATRD